jgi:hypothetical protein
MTFIPPRREVSPRELRRIFNEADFEGRARSADLQIRVLREHHPSAPKASVPFCTRSQSIAYLDANGDEVAMAHRYVQPDGTLGASGFPDPKRVLHRGMLYVAWWEPRGGRT